MSPRTPAHAPAPAPERRPDPTKPFVDVAELCHRYAVKPRTVYSWLERSKGGGIYDKPNRRAPEPAGYTGGDPDTGRGGNPWWHTRQLDAWDDWRANMVGSGAGGGRPRKTADEAQ